MIKIIKQTSGNILIQGVGKDTRYHYLNASKEVWVNNDEIQLKERGLITYSFKFEDVESTQVLPATEVAPTDIRELADTLQSDFFFELSGGGGVIDGAFVLDGFTNVSYSGDQDNLEVSGLDDVSVLYINATVPINITGIKAPTGAKRQLLQLVNTSANGVTIPRESVSSDPENRFYGIGSGVTLNARGTIFLMYDPFILTGRWRYF